MKRPSLKTAALWAWCVWCLALACVGADEPTPAVGIDVPSAASDEIARRGNMVTERGDGIRGGVEDLLADTWGTPPDDSHKWFVSVVVSDNCPACDRLLADFRASPYLAAWAKPDDLAGSWSHFNVYQLDDPTQRFRLEKMHIASTPTLIIQPPLNRQYGDPSTVVLQQTGYDGNAKGLSDKIRAVLTAYVAKQPHAEALLSGGHRQAAAGDYSPPWSPSPFPLSPSTTTIPPGPTAATLDQLAAACPGADADFLLSQLRAGATVEAAQAAWRIKQAATTPTTPTTPASPSGWLLALTGLLGGTNMLTLVALGLSIWRSFKKASGQALALTDAQFDLVTKLLQGQTTPANQTTPAATVRTR